MCLNRVSIEFSCLLRNGLNLAMKNASKFLPVLPSFGAGNKILHKKECSLLSARCWAGSDLLSAELCSDQRPSTLQMVSPMKVCIYLYKFCITVVNHDFLMEKVILLSSLTITKTILKLQKSP